MELYVQTKLFDSDGLVLETTNRTKKVLLYVCDMKNLILTLIITLPLTLLGQGWEQTYPYFDIDIEDNQSNFVIECSNNDILFTGFNDDYDDKLFIVKLNFLGDTLWTKKIDIVLPSQFNPNILSHSVVETSDGYLFLSNWDDDPYDRGVFVVKTTFSGDLLGYNHLNNIDEGEHIEKTNDNGFIVSGHKNDNSICEVVLTKLDEVGNQQWTNSYESGSTHNGCNGICVQQTYDEGFIILTESSLNSHEEILIKTNSIGDTLWTRNLEIVNQQEITELGYVRQTNDNGYILTGYNDNDNITLIKLNQDGILSWEKEYGGVDYDRGNSVIQTNDGGFIICGYTSSYGSGNEDVYIIKTDIQGDSVWSKTFGSSDEDLGLSIQETSDDGFLIGGIKTEWGSRTVYLIKTNSFGNTTSTIEIPLPNPNRKLEKTVNLKGQEIKSQTNQPIIEIFDDGSVEKKLIIEK